MKALPEAIAFAALAVSAAWLEVSGKDAFLLWFLLGLWAMFSDWGQKE